MKTSLLLLLLLLLSTLSLFSQEKAIAIEYDQSGNRVLRSSMSIETSGASVTLNSPSADYYMQQSIQVMFTNDLSKSAFNYKYRGRKMGIVSFKALHYGLFYRP